MKKTKIICSIGPASQSVDVMSQMVQNGMNVARINFSHGSYQEYDEILNTIKESRIRTNMEIGVLYDTKGPDFRCGTIKEEGIKLVPGELVKMVKENVVGTDNFFSVNHPEVLDKWNCCSWC